MTALVEAPVVEHRSAHVADVNFPKRIITVVAMPYEQPTDIVQGRQVFTEIVSRGAFDGIERRTSQIKVNRDHNWEKPVGRVVATHPSRTEGLVTEIKISGPTSQLAQESLELAADGILDASAGFGLLRQGPNGQGPVYPDAETWENDRSLRRLNRLYLDHVALVANPAYPGATVLDVRDASVRPQDLSGDATPNRDWIAFQNLKARSDALNAKYRR